MRFLVIANQHSNLVTIEGTAPFHLASVMVALENPQAHFAPKRRLVPRFRIVGRHGWFMLLRAGQGSDFMFRGKVRHYCGVMGDGLPFE